MVHCQKWLTEGTKSTIIRFTIVRMYQTKLNYKHVLRGAHNSKLAHLRGPHSFLRGPHLAREPHVTHHGLIDLCRPPRNALELNVYRLKEGQVLHHTHPWNVFVHLVEDRCFINWTRFRPRRDDEQTCWSKFL